MTVQYCDRCGMQMEEFIVHMTYAGNNEVELCEECFDKFERWLACENIEDRLERIIDRAEKVMQNEWVSVYDRMPEPSERVLATDGRNMIVTWCEEVDGDLDFVITTCGFEGFEFEALTHWMPLPIPPDER